MSRIAPEERVALLREYGGYCLAYSTLQSAMQYFDLPGVGYVAYMESAGRRYVLGDPVCHPQDLTRMLDAALRDCRRTAFVQTQEPTARVLHDAFGFSVTRLGPETTLHASDYRAKTERQNTDPAASTTAVRGDRPPKRQKAGASTRVAVGPARPTPELTLGNYLNGNRMEFIRRQFAYARKAGVVITETAPEDWDIAALDRISREWLNSRETACRELQFLTRPFTPTQDADHAVRLFSANVGDRLVGFLALDPMYRGGRAYGYYADIRRLSEDAPRGTGHALLLTAMAQLFSEDCEQIALGMSPFANMNGVYEHEGCWTDSPCTDADRRIDNRLITWFFGQLYNRGRRIYDAPGQYFFKTRFRGRQTQTYVCTGSLLPIGDLIGGLAVCGLKLSRAVACGLLTRRA